MICFKDRTFCGSPNCKNECGRQLTPEVQEAARKWWGGKGAPISIGFFCEDEPDEKVATKEEQGKT